VFENGVLRRISGPKRDEVTRGWRKLHNKKFHDFYSLPSMIKLGRMRWTGHLAGKAEKRNIYIGYWWESQRERTTRKTKP
jgi:hypothetical protein